MEESPLAQHNVTLFLMLLYLDNPHEDALETQIWSQQHPHSLFIQAVLEFCKIGLAVSARH